MTAQDAQPFARDEPARESDLRMRSPSFSGLHASSPQNSRTKQHNKRKDTEHELTLRRELYKRGLRYRLHVDSLPGRPDIVFPGARVVIFCDGDFWHGRNWESRSQRLAAGFNGAYWIAKITSNMERDRRQTDELIAGGWTVIRLWETDIKRDPAASAALIARHVLEARVGKGNTAKCASSICLPD